jgi:hypothetical protein
MPYWYDYHIPNNVLYLKISNECDAYINSFPKYLLFCAEFDMNIDIDLQSIPYIVYMDTSGIETTELLMNLMYIHISCMCGDMMIKNQYMQHICISNYFEPIRTIDIGVNYLSCLEVTVNELDKVIKQTDRPILMRTIRYKCLRMEVLKLNMFNYIHLWNCYLKLYKIIALLSLFMSVKNF